MKNGLKMICAAFLVCVAAALCSCGIKTGKAWGEASPHEDSYYSVVESSDGESGEDISGAFSEESPEETSEEISEETSEAKKPEITYFAVETGEQKLEWSINGDVISLELPYTFDISLLKHVKPEIIADGAVTGLEQGGGYADLTRGFFPLSAEENALYLTVTGENGATSMYEVKTDYKYLNLPVMFVEIDGGGEVVSKETDLFCSVSLDCRHCGGAFPTVKPSRAAIHGRGHYSWQFDKKSYTIKFDEKQNILGLGKAKRWVLTANYTDKSLLQNYLALEMAKKLTNLRYTPTQHPVDLFINGVYRGVYTLGEKIEVKNHRIELETEAIENPAFLIELGGAEEGGVAGTDYFNIGLLKALTINYPDSENITDEQKEYILDYLEKADKAVRTKDKYEEYIDIDSLIDWVILYEFTTNTDGVFRRSCYMYKDAGGRLCMGPVWDFDLAFGNFLKYEKDTWACLGDDEGYVPYNWMNILLGDAEFRAKLKSRWDEIKDALYSHALEKLDFMAGEASLSAESNFKVWDILGMRVLSNPRDWYKWQTWEAQVQRIHDYLAERYLWMDSNF